MRTATAPSDLRSDEPWLTPFTTTPRPQATRLPNRLRSSAVTSFRPAVLIHWKTNRVFQAVGRYAPDDLARRRRIPGGDSPARATATAAEE